MSPFVLLPAIIRAQRYSVGPLIICLVIEAFHKELITGRLSLFAVLAVLSIGMYFAMRDMHALGRYVMDKRDGKRK